MNRKMERNRNENNLSIVRCVYGIMVLFVYESHQPRQQKFVTFQSHWALGISNSHFLNEHFTIVEHFSISFNQVF